MQKKKTQKIKRPEKSHSEHLAVVADHVFLENIRLHYADGQQDLFVDLAKARLSFKEVANADFKNSQASLALKLTNLPLGPLLKTAENTNLLQGNLSFETSLTADIHSLKQLRKTLQGTALTQIGPVKTNDAALFKMIGPRGSRAIKSWLTPLPQITCFVHELNISRGKADSRVFLLNTNQFTLSGTGGLNLANLGLNLVFALDAHQLKLMNLANHIPLHIRGTALKPRFGVTTAGVADALFKDSYSLVKAPFSFVATMLHLDQPPKPEQTCDLAKKKARASLPKKQN